MNCKCVVQLEFCDSKGIELDCTTVWMKLYYHEPLQTFMKSGSCANKLGAHITQEAEGESFNVQAETVCLAYVVTFGFSAICVYKNYVQQARWCFQSQKKSARVPAQAGQICHCKVSCYVRACAYVAHRQPRSQAPPSFLSLLVPRFSVLQATKSWAGAGNEASSQTVKSNIPCQRQACLQSVYAVIW